MLNDLQELTFVTTADSKEAKEIKEEYYVVTKVANQWKEFIIDSVKDTDESELLKEVKATLSSVELNDSLLEQHVAGNDPEALLTAILKDTRWTVGIVESGIYNKSFKTSLQFMSVLEAVFELQSAFNCDINFSYVIEENRVVRRQVSLFSRLGADEGKRFEIDKDVISIEREVDSTQLATAIYPVQITEDEDGKTVVTTIADLEWKKSAGDPVDKPKGQKFIGDPIALSNWGRKDSKGLLTHRIKLYEFNEEVTVAQMASMSWVNLGRYVNPKITYTANVVDLYELFGEEYAHEKVVIGDTVTVIDRYFSVPIETVERVIEIERDLIDPTNNVITLGDSQREYSSDRAANRDSVNSAFDLANKAQKNSSVALESADGKSTNYYGTVAPKNPKENDLWFRPHPDNPTEQQMVQWDGTQWVVRADTSEITQVKDKVEKAEQEAEEAKQSAEDAVQKAGQAVADAGFAKDQSDGALSKAITAEGAANQAKTDAQSALDAYNNLEIGGRNYQKDITKNTQPSRGTTVVTGQHSLDITYAPNTVNSPYIMLQRSNPLYAGVEYIVSFYVTLKSSTPFTLYYGLRFEGGFPDKYIVLSEVDKKILITHKFTPTEDGSPGTIFFKYVNAKYDRIIIEEYMIAKGNQILDWSPNPEDVQVQITDINGELSRKVSQQTFDTLQGTVNTQSTQVNQNKADILLRATKTEVNTLTGTVNSLDSQLKLEAGKISALNSKTDGHTTEIGSLQSSFSGLNSTVATVKQDLDGLEIGGRNLLRNTKKEVVQFSKTVWDWNPHNLTTQEVFDMGIKVGVSLIYRIYIDKPTIKAGAFIQFTSTAPAYRQTFGNMIAAGESGWSTATVTVTEQDLLNLNTMTLSVRGKSSGTGSVGLAMKKLEKGNKATDWSPAPEDMATVTQFSSIEQTVTGIQSTVANKAEQSEVTQLAGQWSATVAKVDGHTGQIANLGTDINLRVKKDGLIGEINLQAGKTIFRQGDNVMMITPTTTYIQDATIKTAHIADLAVSGAKIANASISSAKIISLDASKITVGTLTGHTINSAVINGGTISGGTINGTNITGGTFYNSGTRGEFRVYDGMVKATSYNTVANGTILSEDGYITLRAGGTGSASHVFLQSVTEVRATRPREFNTYIPMVALEFRIPGWTYLARNVWSTYGNGIEDMFIKPSDVGSLRVMSAGNGSYRPIMASAFNQSSSREFKENIESLQESGLEVIRGFNIVTYNLKDDPNKEIQVGLIAEDNRAISSFEGDSINIYKMTSYNSKAIQELDASLDTVTQQLTTVATERLQHTLLLESKLLSLENTVLQLQQEIEQLRTV